MAVWLLVVVVGVQAQGGTEIEGREVGVAWPVLEELEGLDRRSETGPKGVDTAVVGLWVEALGRDEVEVRREAVRALGTVVRDGGTGEGVVQALRGALGDSDAGVRLAAVAGLAGMERGDDALSAALLAMVSAGGREAWGSEARYVEAVRVVDDAVGRWGYDPAVGAWVERVGDGGQPTAVRVSAARALGGWGAGRAGGGPDASFEDSLSVGVGGGLLEVAEDGGEPLGLRVAAAEAVGGWVQGGAGGAGVLQAASGLTQGDDVAGRFVAVRLLAGLKGAGGEAANEVLERLMRRGLEEQHGGALAAAAAGALTASDPARVAAVAERLMASRDAAVRREGAKALGRVAFEGGVPKPLLKALADPAVSVRAAARGSLLQLSVDEADEAQRRAVERAVVAALRAEGGRARVEAAHLIGQRGWWSGAEAITAMLREGDATQLLAAASAVRRLLPIPDGRDDAATQKALLASALARLTELAPIAQTSEDSTPAQVEAATLAGQEAGQLLSGVAMAAAASADPTLRSQVDREIRGWVTTKSHDELARASATWALGELHRGDADAAAVKLLRDRLMDTSEQNPESPRVQRAAAMALGKIGGDAATAALRQAAGDGEIGDAATAALGQPPPTSTSRGREWWLEPVGR